MAGSSQQREALGRLYAAHTPRENGVEPYRVPRPAEGVREVRFVEGASAAYIASATSIPGEDASEVPARQKRNLIARAWPPAFLRKVGSFRELVRQ